MVKKYLCPKCRGELELDEDGGLWCTKGCYESTFAVWVAMGGKV
jgi:hypothetical protein